MSFFRKIFGLGPKEPMNVRPREKDTSIKKTHKTSTSSDEDISGRKIYPTLVSQKTREFELEGELMAIFHEREGLFANVLIGHVMIDENKVENGEVDIYQVRTFDKNEEEHDQIRLTGETNFDDFEVPFIPWNPTDDALNYQVLSCKISFLSSEKVLSKKHMDEAHKLLNAEELLVSIPRKGLIFVCSRDLSEEDYNHFLHLHASIVLQENNELELLCEDLFVFKDGKMEGSFELKQLSEILLKS